MPTAERRCPRCRARTITGVTLPPGFAVEVDPAVLDPAAELEAILEGRWTYTLHTGADQLAHRGARQIEGRPAGSRVRESVHREHRCEGRA